MHSKNTCAATTTTKLKYYNYNCTELLPQCHNCNNTVDARAAKMHAKCTAIELYNYQAHFSAATTTTV